jgi:hypothetical protein
MFLPETKNVFCRINVTIMNRAATITLPVSYSQACDTFRAADASAFRAGLGSHSFVNFNKSRPVPSGFVRKLRFECSPSSIKYGFSHPRFDHLGRTYISDDDQFVFTSYPRRPFMKMMFSTVLNFGVDGCAAFLLASALSSRKLSGIFSYMARVVDNAAITQGRHGLEAEVNSNRAVPGREVIWNFARKANKPFSGSILNECSAFYVLRNTATLPEEKLALHEGDGPSVETNVSGDERHPAERSFGAAASAVLGVFSVLVPALDKLSADFVHCVTMDAQFCRGSGAKFHKIKVGWPPGCLASFPPSLCLSLNLATIVPNLIYAPRPIGKLFPLRGVFDAKFKGQKHPSILTHILKGIQP